MANKGESPYSTKFASGDIDHTLDTSSAFRQYKKEERESSKGPNTLPYEMSNLPQYFGMMVDNGMQASICLENLLKTRDVRHKKTLLKLKKDVEKMVIYLLQNVDQVLEKFTIGANHAIDDREQAELDEKLY